MEKIIIIGLIVIIIIAVVVFRIRSNGRRLSDVDRTTRKLREANEARQANDIGIRTDIGTIEEKTDDLRRNNLTRSDIDRETKNILARAKHR